MNYVFYDISKVDKLLLRTKRLIIQVQIKGSIQNIENSNYTLLAMNLTLVNILETSPFYSYNYSLQQLIPFDNTDTMHHLIITFELILLSTLNHAKLKELALFSFNIGKLQSLVKIVLSNDFDYESMKYDTSIQFQHQEQYITQYSASIDKHNYQQTKAQSIALKFSLKSNFIQAGLKRSKLNFLFGNQNLQNKNTFQGKFSINNFSFRIQPTQKLRRQSTAVSLLSGDISPAMCNYDFEEGSFPIVYENDLKNLKSIGMQNLEEMIKNLPPYNATNTTEKKSHLFICHDMKGGYAEDTLFTNPMQKRRTNSYRFSYFWQTSIFNYFSHKTITIPPRHWRQLCKRYQVKCLGTFIVEPQHIDQNYYLQTQFALKLVYVAKRIKFDGYLINIEETVKKIVNLQEWLKILTEKIHLQIPGSIISWYDSVTDKGLVQYQNQINQNNKVFYDLTDNFYTNYWWDDQKLKDDIASAKPNKTIYVGNDVWGRGTFGGGEYDLYKAIDQIQKQNNSNFGAALFGQAYTYQKGGQNNNPRFKLNEDKLYRGVLFDEYDIAEWKPLAQKEEILKLFQNSQTPSASGQANTNGIKLQSKWSAKNLWLYKKKGPLKLSYLYRINDTLLEPDSTLDYKIVLKIRDSRTDQTFVKQQKQSSAAQLIKDSVKKVSIFLNTQNMTSKTDLQIVKSQTVEGLFIRQKIVISYYDSDKDWIQEVPTSTLFYNSPYNTYFNLGHGDSFFYRGTPFSKSYDYMADFDFPSTLSLNHPFATDIEYHEAYIGGSSVLLTQNVVKLLTFDLPLYQHSYPLEYMVKLASKGGQIQALYLSQSNGFSVYLNKSSQTIEQNGWKSTIYYLPKEKLKKVKKMFFKQYETSISVVLKDKCLLGQLKVKPLFAAAEQKIKPRIEFLLSQSFKSLSQEQIFLNLQIKESLSPTEQISQLPERYLVVIGDIFACFIYMSRQGLFGRGKLEQIPIILQKSKANIKIINTDSYLQQTQVLVHTNIDLIELKQNIVGHKILLRNF